MSNEALTPAIPDAAANLAQAPVDSFAETTQAEVSTFDDLNAALGSTLTPEEIAQFGGAVPEDASPAHASQQPPAPAAPAAPQAPAIDPALQAILEQNAAMLQQMQFALQQSQQETAALRSQLAPKQEPPKRPAEFKSLEEYEAYLEAKLEREKLGPLQAQLKQAVDAVQAMQRQAQVSQVDSQTTGLVRNFMSQRFPQVDAQKAPKVERALKELAVNMAMTYRANSVDEVMPLLAEILDDITDGKINAIQSQAQASVRQAPQARPQVPARIPMTAPAAGLDLPEYSKAELTNAGYANYMEASHDGFRRLPRK